MVRFTPLTGGVASDIWKVESGPRRFVVKQALARLRVAREWRVPVGRNAAEVGWLQLAGSVARGSAPRVLAHDPACGAFAMDYLDPGSHPVWKAELARGHVDPSFARAVGACLATIHNATAGDASVARRFANDATFHSIRLEPYFEATAHVHTDLAEQLFGLARDTLATRRALVHGDVSPKNILVGPQGPVFLDAECAWYGDPAFDLAFCLNHLLLKMLLRPEARPALAACFTGLSSAYFATAASESQGEIEARAARLLPALLLARVDGKSPVEYITDEPDRARVRRTAIPLVRTPPPHVSTVLEAWMTELLA